jgi:cbb3-type cytochrome oxidase subunit 1
VLDWISEKIMATVTFVPALFVDQHSPSFHLVRAMFGLLLITLVVYVIAMMSRSARISNLTKKLGGLFGKRAK